MKLTKLFGRGSLSLSCISTCFLSLALASAGGFAEDVKKVVSEGEARLTDNQQSQRSIDKISEQTQDIVSSYHEKLKIVDGLKIYNKLLALQLQEQEQEMEKYLYSITNAAVIERQILPMLLKMTDSLEEFVDKDIPFLTDERHDRVKKLRKLIASANLSNAEKARRVFEAFQIETDYGSTIESYKGKLNLAAQTYDVDYLRIGRVALLYRTVGSEGYGFWDETQAQWVPLKSSNFERNIDRGIKIANQEVAPELITIPLKLSKEEL